MSRAAQRERPSAPSGDASDGPVLRLSREEHDRTISDRLALALEGVSTQRLAELTGFNHETVRRYISGQRPSARFVSTVCAQFGLNPNWVLLGEGLAWNSTDGMAVLSTVPTREIGKEIAARLKKR